MSNSVSFICAVCAFGFGTLAAYINLLISRRGVNSDSVASIMGHNMARMLVDIVTLGIVFLVCRRFELPMVICLVATALGLTVCGTIMLSGLAKSVLNDKDKDGGE